MHKPPSNMSCQTFANLAKQDYATNFLIVVKKATHRFENEHSLPGTKLQMVLTQAEMVMHRDYHIQCNYTLIASIVQDPPKLRLGHGHHAGTDMMGLAVSVIDLNHILTHSRLSMRFCVSCHRFCESSLWPVRTSNSSRPASAIAKSVEFREITSYESIRAVPKNLATSTGVLASFILMPRHTSSFQEGWHIYLVLEVGPINGTSGSLKS